MTLAASGVVIRGIWKNGQLMENSRVVTVEEAEEAEPKDPVAVLMGGKKFSHPSSRGKARFRQISRRLTRGSSFPDLKKVA